MSEALDELGVTRGRAYTRGDVVILRFTRHASREMYGMVRDILQPVEQSTGVRFVVLDQAIEVVEPSAVL